MEGSKQIGFSQRIQLEWLERIAALVLAGSDRAEITTALDGLLRRKVSVGGSAERGNLEKAVSILMKIWFHAPANLESLRKDGLALIRDLPKDNHIAVHWGMSMAVYPFFGAVATTVGRLLKLQGSAAASHVQRRIREVHGERDTVSRAARRILRVFIDWGVLREGNEKGVYVPGKSHTLSDHRLVLWLIEAALRGSDRRAVDLASIWTMPSLFPFHLNPVPQNAMARSGRIALVRHGLDEVLVSIAEKA